MRLYPERTVAEIERLPGADHSYLKQLCAGDGAQVRDALRRTVDRLGPPFSPRAVELLTSLDNRRFFQGYAETVSLSLLSHSGWTLRDLVGGGPRLVVARAGAPEFALSVLAFLHQTRPGGDAQTRQRLVEGLSRVTSRHRFVVLVRRWLPHDLDVEPVRRAIEMWLGQVQGGAWEGRYAAYEDDHVSLEFCLSGEKVKGRQSPLILVIGPFASHRAMEVIEPRVVRELDLHNAGPLRDKPLLVVCAADQPWQVNDGYLRDFLYGRPSLTVADDLGTTWTFGGTVGPCTFRDPLYRGFAGLVLLDRDPTAPLDLRARAWLNPWARVPLRPTDLPCTSYGPLLAEEPRNGPASDTAAPTMRWYLAKRDALPIV